MTKGCLATEKVQSRFHESWTSEGGGGGYHCAIQIFCGNLIGINSLPASQGVALHFCLSLAFEHHVECGFRFQPEYSNYTSTPSSPENTSHSPERCPPLRLSLWLPWFLRSFQNLDKVSLDSFTNPPTHLTNTVSRLKEFKLPARCGGLHFNPSPREAEVGTFLL